MLSEYRYVAAARVGNAKLRMGEFSMGVAGGGRWRRRLVDTA
jgi:hypothetical protein